MAQANFEKSVYAKTRGTNARGEGEQSMAPVFTLLSLDFMLQAVREKNILQDWVSLILLKMHCQFTGFDQPECLICVEYCLAALQ